jgi:ATP-dependent DNA helicase RecG
VSPSPAPAPFSSLDRPVQFLRGVGPKRAETLSRLGLNTARDLLFHVPRRYEDASTLTPIRALQVGMDASVVGEVVSKGVLPTRKGLRIFQAVLRDATGMVECSWPGQPFLDRVIGKGDVLLVTGPVRFFHGRQLQPREHVVLGSADEAGADAFAGGLVLPIYPATEGLPQRLLRSILEHNLDALLAAAEGEEPFTAEQLAAAGVPPLRDALTRLHRPASLAEAEEGRRRLAYGELFFLQLLHARARAAAQERPGIAFRRTGALVNALYRRLPFQLTGAQTAALREIFRDMESPARMNRLLQGDVGSGKTIVALFAMLLAAEAGYQAALMAPTELLAEQHARRLAELLDGIAPPPLLLTGSLGAAARRDALRLLATWGNAEDVAPGVAPGALVVGTHALIQDEVRFARLGLAVVDEQHRFGVKQRLALAAMGERPDVLVMSATPIPRSLALTLYGELELSVLDERPPGRQPVRTGVRPEKARGQVHAFVREQVAAGRQAYIVYPLVEESEKVDLKAATEEYEHLRGEVFPDLRLGLIHGQLPAEEKDATMRAFAAGALDVLVSTTVIEVGIDVANATVMVVEHAERFGLSQLHQLRGRIGRGAAESYCILLASGGDEARARLRVVQATDDGFEIARADLRLRGMGDFFGARQHGLPEFRFFDPERDEELLERARYDARQIIDADPALDSTANRRVREALEQRYGERARLYTVG